LQAGQNVVQQFEQALSGGNVIAASDLKWPAATPTSVTEMFDLQRRYFEQMGQLWNSFLPGLSGDERKPVVAPRRAMTASATRRGRRSPITTPSSNPI